MYLLVNTKIGSGAVAIFRYKAACENLVRTFRPTICLVVGGPQSCIWSPKLFPLQCVYVYTIFFQKVKKSVLLERIASLSKVQNFGESLRFNTLRRRMAAVKILLPLNHSMLRYAAAF